MFIPQRRQAASPECIFIDEASVRHRSSAPAWRRAAAMATASSRARPCGTVMVMGSPRMRAAVRDLFAFFPQNVARARNLINNAAGGRARTARAMNGMHEESGQVRDAATRGGNTAEVFAVFLRLGVTCFGGPIAHIGYFHEEFVVRRRWLDEKTYVDLVALCQFLPGPASAKSASPSGCRARAIRARSPRGPALRCRRRSRWCCSAMASPRSATRCTAAGCTG